MIIEKTIKVTIEDIYGAIKENDLNEILELFSSDIDFCRAMAKRFASDMLEYYKSIINSGIDNTDFYEYAYGLTDEFLAMLEEKQ